jgi:serine/threonine protein phosphatase 1
MNQLTFAIGDIHGEMFLLHQLVKQCLAHAKVQETEAHFVFLGDYVDRGPRSNEVIAFLRKLPNATCLRGNHDQMMCEAVIHKNRDSKYWWLNNGGLRTIESYAGAKLFSRNGHGVCVDLGRCPLARQLASIL